MESMWATKYRPTTPEEIVGQEALMLDEMQPSHLLLHSRHAGVGKTSFAYALAAKFGYQLHVFNASSKKTRGIEFVEEELLPMSRVGNFNQFFLLDEADQLTPAAQSALKAVIENAQGYFILTCNELEKVDITIRSRCFLKQFKPIPKASIIARLARIAGNEGVEITESQLGMIADAHEGDLRSSINCLQAYSCFASPIQGKQFLLGLTPSGFVPMDFLQAAFIENDFDLAFSLITAIDNYRHAVREVFNYAIKNVSTVESKVKVIDAAVVAERDFIAGVDELAAVAHFCTTLANGTQTL